MNRLMLIIKVTHKCNMRCAYCYDSYSPASNDKIVNIAFIQTVLHWLKGYTDNSGIDAVDFVWHGGEPLLAGRNFYEKVYKMQQDILDGLVFSNGIQTNGISFKLNIMNLFSSNQTVAIGDNWMDPYFSFSAPLILTEEIKYNL